jgi:hypothetical protein
MADNNDIEFEEFDAKNRHEILGIYHILLALMIVLTSHGFMLGNNGSDGDFALNYCNDSDVLDTHIDYSEPMPPTTTKEFVAQESFFACEIGFIDGTVDLGWEILIDEYHERVDDVMILNHENYKKFVTGETFIFDAGNPLWHLSDFDNEHTTDSLQIISNHKYDITLSSDTYFFVVTKGGYDIWGSPEDAPKHDGSFFESNTKCNFGNFDFRLDSVEDACQYSSFYYTVDLDYNDEIFLTQTTTTN